MESTYNVNIVDVSQLPTPSEIKTEYPLALRAADTVVAGRKQIEHVLARRDPRHLMIVGPCSVHNLEDALTYAERLRALAGQVRERILLVMRVYFEKPRTSLGWKGLIYDPELDNSAKIALGLRLARKIMLEIVSMGVLTASELLDPVIPQYITDLLCWAAIGARTVESQTHRQMASGLSMPIGVKNSTDGNVAVAIHAIKTAASPHTFIGIMEDGRVGVFHTRGNPFGHLVLRGGHNGPNYGTEYIAFARELMRKARITPNIVVDCSHDNSRKQPERQIDVMRDAIRQIIAGDRDIVGTMLESNLIGGRQNIPKDLRDLKPGVSITDACMGWGETEALITEAYEALGEPSREMVQPIESR
jgi:3-deoxy-7-phosphoheptulonate synthase